MSGESLQFVPRSPASGVDYVPALERINHQECGLFDHTAMTGKHAKVSDKHIEKDERINT